MKNSGRLARHFIQLIIASLLISNTGHTVASSDGTNTDNVRNAILTICPPGNLLGAELQTRCNAVAGAGLPTDIMTQVTSEQTASQKSASLEMNNTQLSSVSNRISAVRGGQSSGLNISGLMYDSNGKPLSTAQLDKLSDNFNRTAAGDENFDRLGVFVNANIGFGDRITTSNEAGYNMDSHGTTVGIDYRFTDNFLLGSAFSYSNSNSRYTNNLGELETDNYSGAIYASFFTEQGFFIDGVFSGSLIDYDSRRHIEYTVSESINTNAYGNNSGDSFNVSMTTGYNFNIGGLTLTPLVKVDYTATHVDSLDERGGRGWALHIDGQDFDSMQTAAGLQIAYAISLPWGVISPMVQTEYIHEFKNDARNITSRYIQDTSNTYFKIRTDRPDRDYISLTAGISAQFIHGISAFVSYDTVQAHSFVGNHNFTGGVRMELPF